MTPDEAPEPFARIDVQTIYALLLTVRDSTQRLEGKVDSFHANIERVDERLLEQQRQLGAVQQELTQLRASGAGQEHEGRIRKLEAWKYAIPPTVLVGIAGIAVALLRGGP